MLREEGDAGRGILAAFCVLSPNGQYATGNLRARGAVEILAVVGSLRFAMVRGASYNRLAGFAAGPTSHRLRRRVNFVGALSAIDS
jgi:hypothetical protein